MKQKSYSNNNLASINSNMIKVGLYGGSFNPIHNGHINTMQKILDTGIVDKIRILPCKHHVYNKDLEDIEYRIDMIHKAIRHIPNIVIDYTEAESTTKNYTANTLKKLRIKNSNENYSFIVGSDVFNDIHTWGGHEYIRNTTPLIVVRREGHNIIGASSDSEKSIKGFKLDGILHLDDDVSSTTVRTRLKAGESIDDLVPKKVEEYIIRNNLYAKQKEYKNPAATSDAIAEYEGKIILIKRKFSPFKGYWAIPGGFLECNKESLEQACVREFKEEVSVKAKIKNIELLGVYSKPGRDPRGHVISHAYVIKEFKGIPQGGDDAEKDIGLFAINKLPKRLAFDHAKILSDYSNYKKRNGSKIYICS